MSATTLAAIVAIVAGYASGITATLLYLGGRIDRLEQRMSERLDRVEERLTALEVTVAQIGQRLDDHITDHPGPTERLVR